MSTVQRKGFTVVLLHALLRYRLTETRPFIFGIYDMLLTFEVANAVF